MAPSKASERNKRESDYSNIGVAGRKTGVTLKDTGIRDEHGLEPLDGIFSSPEKSPPKRNGVNHNSTIGEESMDIGESTIPEPTEVLTSRRKGKAILPPPRARSPIKTTLNSSPRRSIGPGSSPSRRRNDTPTRASSYPIVNRRLDFSIEQPRQSIERSSQKGRSLLSTANGSKKNKGKGKKRTFDLSMESDGEPEIEGNTSIIDSLDTPADVGLTYEDSLPLQPLENGDESLHLNGDEELVEEETQQDLGDLSEALPEEIQAQPKSKRGRPPKRDSGVGEASLLEVETQPVVAKIKKKAGRPKATLAKIIEPQINGNSEIIEQSEMPEEAQVFEESQDAEEHEKPKRGRPKKDQAIAEISGDEANKVEAKPSKPEKRHKSTPIKAIPISQKRKGPKPPPSERDPNARITSTKKIKEKESSTFSRSTSIKPGPRSLTILRSETPAEDIGARLMRSGRRSVKPTAWWQNERIIYGDLAMDGKDLVLPGIKEVIRATEIVDPRPKTKRSAYRRTASKRQKLEDVEEEESEDEQEPWEQDPGILAAEVVHWNPLGRRGFEEIEEIELANAPVAIKALTREVQGANFRYAKMLSLPFFGSGMVDLPPGGEKRVKNSGRMQLVFFMFRGRVTVDVAGMTFGIGEGGMWQVPRGNFYGISNPNEKPALIFFAQGCDVSGDLGGSGE